MTSDKAAMEKALRNLSAAIQHSSATVVITDLQGDIEYVNPRFTETSGYDLHEVLGRNPRLLKSGEGDAGTYRDLWATLAAGEVWRGELHNRKKDGGLYWEQASISPVRDEQGVRTSLAKAGYEVEEAADGQEAWEIYLSAPDLGRFSLIMTDILMPRMDGLELVSKIRQVDPKIPVVILSASEAPVDLESARTLQISELINKPFDPKGLFDCVKFFLSDT